ncbi:MAG TPA: GYF domain-containing protein [Opitutaceae bacterium]|nr:GYF domain-containing protein [Opitutaceae bacterium]
MATQELYIRNASETEARGPFNAQQIADLAEAGQVTTDTLVYDANTEQWVALNTNTELMATVFPEKKKLVLKAKEIKTLNKPDEHAKEISVNDMLAAAEGRTADTKSKADPEAAMARAARLGLIGATVTLVAAAAAEILPSTDALLSGDVAKILAHPLVVLGVIDLFFAVMLGLGTVTFYPIVRFRAALGLGLMGFMFYAQGLSLPLIEVAAGSVGLYLCTIVVSLVPALVAVLAGVGGMGALAWFFLSH